MARRPRAPGWKVCEPVLACRTGRRAMVREPTLMVKGQEWRDEATTNGDALRASSYTIYVDLPNEPDAMLLVHGYSGAYDKVTRRVATYVRSLETGKPPRPLFGTWSPEAPIDGAVIRP